MSNLKEFLLVAISRQILFLDFKPKFALFPTILLPFILPTAKSGAIDQIGGLKPTCFKNRLFGLKVKRGVSVVVQDLYKGEFLR